MASLAYIAFFLVPANPSLYVYEADIVSVYDADTVTADIRLGFDVSYRARLRLYGINAWEVRGEEKQKGLVARDWLRERLNGRTVLVRTFRDKKGKFGRWLAILYVIDKDSPRNVNAEAVSLGHAKVNFY